MGHKGEESGDSEANYEETRSKEGKQMDARSTT